jgi:RNA polymerase sigma-70 factor, ECF subfamily
MTSEVPIPDVDAALVERTLLGQSVAFEVLVVKYQRRVAAAIRRLVRNDGIVEELAQEAFLKAYTGLSGFRPEAAFQPWLMAIARNTALDHLRSSRSRVVEVPFDLATDGHGDGNTDGAESGRAVVAGPEDEAAARQLFAQIDRAIETLPEAQRRALLLREVDGMDYRGIAETLGIPLNTAKSHVLRARDAIADRVRPLLEPTRNRRW